MSHECSIPLLTYVGFLEILDSGSDAASLSTTATPVPEGWVLNGTKSWVTNAHEAKAVIVIALADKSKGHRGTNAYLVPIPIEGGE